MWNPHYGIVGGGSHSILLHGCYFCHVQGWAPAVPNHKTHNCTDPRNQAGRNFARGGGVPVGVSTKQCKYCHVAGIAPSAPPHNTHRCTDISNPNGKAARSGGVPVGVPAKQCKYCHVAGMAPSAPPHNTHRCTDLRNPNGKAAVVARGGGAVALTKDHLSADEKSFWCNDMWNEVIKTVKIGRKIEVTFIRSHDRVPQSKWI